MGMQYSKELANWAEKRTSQKQRQDVAAVAFMAVKGSVVEALQAGFTLTTIWEHMVETGKLKCSYETFRRHVHRFITSAENNSTRSCNSPAEAPSDAPEVASIDARKSITRRRSSKSHTTSTEPPKAASPGLPSFHFNAAPNQEDLI